MNHTGWFETRRQMMSHVIFTEKYFLAESFVEEKRHIDSKFDSWCVDEGIVADDKHKINYVQCKDEGQSLCVVINIEREQNLYSLERGRKTKLSCKGNRGGDYMWWVNEIIEENPKVERLSFL